MTSSGSQKKANPFWRFFSSVKLTIVLLILLAAASILGTVIPQQGQGAVDFAKRLDPAWFRFFEFLDLFDMYHSLWFRVLLTGLSLNLVICSIDRFPGAWRRFRAVPKPDRNRPFADLPADRTFVVRTDAADAAGRVGRFLRSRLKRVREKTSGDRHFFYGEKSAFSLFGVYLVHLSVLVILCGGLVGSFFGFEAYVNISEGEKTGTVVLRKGMKPLKLGFEVRCDRFRVSFYDDGAPKEYRSDLTFFVNGEAVAERSVRVNHPVHFRGITFYQASYGKIPGGKARIGISGGGPDQGTKTVEITPGEALSLPGGEGKFLVTDAKGDFMGMGAAARILIRPEQGKEIHFWIFEHPEKILPRLPGPMAKSPVFNASAFPPYTFYLKGLESAYYTGLQVNRDPGVPIVWTGCFLMIAGFFITFFTSHRRIWIRLQEIEGKTVVSVAGSAGKNPVGLERELAKLTADLKALLSRPDGS